MEKYPRGRRGSPAKGVVRDTVARVQIPLSPPQQSSALCIKKASDLPSLVFLFPFAFASLPLRLRDTEIVHSQSNIPI